MTVLFGACGKAPAPPGPRASATPPATPPSAVRRAVAPSVVKFDAPENCFEALTALKESDDPAAALHCLSEANVNFIAGSMAFQMQRYAALSDGGEASAACLRVLKSHGLAEVDIMEFLQIVDSPVPGGAIPGFMQIGDSIKDKPAFFRESSAATKLVVEKLLKAPEDGDAETKPKGAGAGEKPPPTKLIDVKVSGDRAEGLTIIGDDETTKTKVYFRRENGSWVLALAAEEPSWKEPIQGRFRFSDLLKNRP